MFLRLILKEQLKKNCCVPKRVELFQGFLNNKMFLFLWFFSLLISLLAQNLKALAKHLNRIADYVDNNRQSKQGHLQYSSVQNIIFNMTWVSSLNISQIYGFSLPIPQWPVPSILKLYGSGCTLNYSVIHFIFQTTPTPTLFDFVIIDRNSLHSKIPGLVPVPDLTELILYLHLVSLFEHFTKMRPSG